MRNSLPASAEIRAILARRIDFQKQATGIAAGVIAPDGRRIVAHGHLSGNDSPPVDADTIFQIGSVSKIFTSLLLADMVHRREVSLDDPAAQYLPEHVVLPAPNGKPITLFHLSTHTSGLPPLPANLEPGGPAYTHRDLYQFLSSCTLPRDPGSDFEYSNLGAGLLGHLLARRAGLDYESLVRTRISQPLGMPDTAIALTSSTASRMAAGHTATLAPVPDSGPPVPLAGAGALHSSPHDLLTLLEAFLGYRETPLAPAIGIMLETRCSVGSTNMCLGWFLHQTDGRRIVTNSGATLGFASFAGFDPQERTGAVVLSNASTRHGVDDIGIHLLDSKAALLDPEPPQQHTEVLIDPRLLDRYTGRYQVAPNLVFEITRAGSRLFAQGFTRLPNSPPGDLTALPQFELFAEAAETFFAKVSDTRIVFETSPDGRAAGLTLYRAGRAMPPAPRLY